MRIALDGRYIQDHFPGIGRYTYALAYHLPRLNPEDVFLLLLSPTARNTRFDLKGTSALPNVEPIQVTAAPFSLRQQWEIPQILRRYGADLYHTPYYVIPYVSPCPILVTVHDLIPLHFPQSLPRPRLAILYSLLVRACAHRANHLLVDSAASMRDLEKKLGVPPRKMTCVYLGVDASFSPRPPEMVAAYRSKKGLHKPYVLYVGINKPHKNLPTLLQAWSLLAPSLQRSHTLVLAGPQDPRYLEVRALADRLGISESVRFFGPAPEEELPLLYQGATCFIFPSLYEGFGLPILEAMAMGVPVACSRISSMPEIAGEAAYLFDPHDPQAIANALNTLLTQPDLRQRLTSLGQAQARHFTWERTAKETYAVYRRMAQGKGR